MEQSDFMREKRVPTARFAPGRTIQSARRPQSQVGTINLGELLINGLFPETLRGQVIPEYSVAAPTELWNRKNARATRNERLR